MKEMDTAKIFACRLRELRKSRKITQAELSEKLNMSVMSVRRFEKGERAAKADAIARIAEYFGISSDYLIGLSDIPTRKDETGIFDKLSDEVALQMKAFLDEHGENGSRMINIALGSEYFYKLLESIMGYK